MKKRIKSIIVISLFIIFAVAMTLLVSLNLNYFKVLIEKYIQTFGYFGVLTFSFVLDFLEQPIGPELPISVAILFGLNMWLVVIFAIIGSYSSSMINYYIGKDLLSSRVKNVCDIKGNHKYCRLFSKHGRLALLIASISPVPWVAFCWLSGSFNMKKRDFFVFGLLPRAIRFYTVALIVFYVRAVVL